MRAFTTLSFLLAATAYVGFAAETPSTRPARDLSAELPRIPARSPEDALKMIRVIPGFRAELVAAEPLVFSPVAIDFDENGRAFVCEMVDYPFASPQPLGRIAVLEDVDGDGKYDKRTVLADGLAWPTAVVCYDGGCFVGTAPDIVYLKDTDGDGKADVRKTIFTGFGKQNVQGLLNSFRWGIDNRIHGATGTNGGTIRRADLPADDAKNVAINLSGRDFSFDPRKLDLRAESGGAQHGMSFDDFGRKFVSSNSDHIQQVIYDDYAGARDSHAPMPPARVSIAADGPQAEVFRISPVEPWRIVRTRMRVSGEVKGLVEGGGRAAGYFTGATGVTAYRGDAFPDEFRRQAFVGDVGSNLVHRKALTPTDCVLLTAERLDKEKEFLASEDIWFRPAQFANAPDGSLYVLDVCREVIEHPASIPDSIKQHLDLTNGRDRGRLIRVVPDDYQQKQTSKLGALPTAELVKLLEHRNGWHRDTASRLLYQRQDPTATELLARLAVETKMPEAALHATLTLASLGNVTDFTICTVLQNPHPLVRAKVLPLARQITAASSTRLKVYALSSDASPVVRLQVALLLGEKEFKTDPFPERRADALAEILSTDAADPYISAAALAALPEDVSDVIGWLTNDLEMCRSEKAQAAMRLIARHEGQIGKEKNVDRVLAKLAKLPEGTPPEMPLAIVRGLSEGLARADAKLRAKLTEGRAAEIRRQWLADSQRKAVNPTLPIAMRLEAIGTLKVLDFAEARDPLAALLAGQEPREIQLAAVAALGTMDDPGVGQVLTNAWPRLTPSVRTATIDVLLARPARAMPFLTAIQQGKIPPTDLDATRLARLKQSRDAEVRKIAEAIAEKLKLSPRADVITAYRGALELKGDAAKGKALFGAVCGACHKLDDTGTEIGPNLAAMRSRGAEAVLINVLDPNREVNPQFVEYVVDTEDGRTLSGLMASESSTSVTLLQPGGQKVTIARGEIAKLRGTGLSLMPEGLEKQFDRQGMADLIAFVMKER